MCNSHNGYTNYPTWVVSLWINNDESGQSYWREQAEQCASVGQLADSLKGEIAGENNPLADDANLYVDLLGFALESVNWYEISEGLWGEAHEGEDESDDDSDLEDKAEA